MAKTGEPNGQAEPSLLRSQGDVAVVFFAAHFEPQVGFAKKLPNVAESVMKHVKAPHWAVTVDNKYVIRETNKKFFYLFGPDVSFCQTLGLEPWIANVGDHVEAMSIALNKMDVSRLKKLGLNVQVQMSLGMSHYEMCDLMFGSYLVDREELSATYGKLDDLLLQLHGSVKEIKSKTVIAPQTMEQSRASFLATLNLDAFVEPKFLDTCVKDHYERVSKDCLHLSIEMVNEDVPASGIRSFVDRSFEAAERIAEGTALRIKALKSEAEIAHGHDSTPAE
jgi:hypothetical protein